MVLLYPLFLLTLLYPAGVSVATCFDCRFELFSLSVFSMGLAALSIAAVVCDAVFRKSPGNSILQVLSALMTPFALINAALCIFSCPEVWVLISGLIATGCAFYFTLRHAKPAALKIIALVLSALLAAPVGVLSFFFLVFANIGQTTVVQTVVSPDGEHYAQVIDSDQGALGGDTLVDVYDNSSVDLLLFKIEKKPQRVYFGDWRDYEDMEICWEDEHTLIINGVSHEIE